MGPPEEDGGDPQTLQWLRSAQDGDEASFALLFEHIAPALFTWAELRIRRDLRAYVDPQDVVQEVWLRAWRALDGFDAEQISFRHWIFRVAKNVLLETLRQARRATARGAPLGPSTRLFALQNLPDTATEVSRRVARDESLKAFADQVQALEREDFDLVHYCGLEGLSYREVATRMDLSYDAVAKRWQRLRARLMEAGLPDQLLVAEG